MPDEIDILRSFLEKMKKKKSAFITPFSFKLSKTDELKTSFFGWKKRNGLQYGLTYFKDSDNFSFEYIIGKGLNEYNTMSKALSNEEKKLIPERLEHLMKQVADTQKRMMVNSDIFN